MDQFEVLLKGAEMAKKISRPKHTPPSRAKEETKKSGGKKQFDNTNRGVLFQNDKDGNEARPDMTGTADIAIPKNAKPGDVVKFRLAAWQKESKSGDSYLSINVQTADASFAGKKKKDESDDE